MLSGSSLFPPSEYVSSFNFVIRISVRFELPWPTSCKGSRNSAGKICFRFLEMWFSKLDLNLGMKISLKCWFNFRQLEGFKKLVDILKLGWICFKFPDETWRMFDFVVQ